MGFFNKSSIAGTDKAYINIANGDVFHALAVALIDAFKNAPRLTDDSLVILLDKFFSYYPSFKPAPALITPLEKMQRLIDNYRKSDIVEGLAVVLRDIVLDKVVENPVDYSAALIEVDPQTKIKDLLIPPEVAMKALSQVLGVKINAQLVEADKPIWAREIFEKEGLSASKLELRLQVLDGACFPQVRDKALYLHVGASKIMSVAPYSKHLDTIEPCLLKIQAHNQRLSFTVKQKVQAISLEGLSTEQLLNLYIQYLPQTTPSFNEHKAPLDVTNCAEVKALVEAALAKAIACGHLNHDDLFDNLEQTYTSVAVR